MGTRSADDDDIFPATFFIGYPSNVWEGNSAAGSESYGFWFRFMDLVSEEENMVVGWYAPLGGFVDNKSHSNSWYGIRFSPYGYNPVETAVVANSTIYKNRGQGIYVSLSFRFLSPLIDVYIISFYLFCCSLILLSASTEILMHPLLPIP